MWIGLTIGGVIGAIQLAKAFERRHEPEPPHSRAKLPVTLVLLACTVALAVLGEQPILFAVLALILAVQLGFILAGRNPWWMQGRLDSRTEPRRFSAPPRDLDPHP
jgi:hypothetical protein